MFLCVHSVTNFSRNKTHIIKKKTGGSRLKEDVRKIAFLNQLIKVHLNQPSRSWRGKLHGSAAERGLVRDRPTSNRREYVLAAERR